MVLDAVVLLNELFATTVQFVLMVGVVIGAVVLGAKLRAGKNSKKAEDEE